MARAGCPRSRPAGRSTHFLPHENRQVKCSMSPCEPSRTASPAKDLESRSIPRPQSCARNAVSQGDAKHARHSLPTAPQVQAILPQTGCCSSICWSNASGGGNDERPSDGNSSTTTACGLMPRKRLVLSHVTQRPSGQPAKKGASKPLPATFSSLYPPKYSSLTRFSRPCSGGNSAAKMSIRARTQRKVLDFACTCD